MVSVVMTMVVPVMMMRMMDVVMRLRMSSIMGLEVVRFMLVIFMVMVVMSVNQKQN